MHVIYISYRDDSQAKVWSSSRLVAQGIKQAPKEVLQDGLHISKKALELVSFALHLWRILYNYHMQVWMFFFFSILCQ